MLTRCIQLQAYYENSKSCLDLHPKPGQFQVHFSSKLPKLLAGLRVWLASEAQQH